ncbi:MAG: ribulose-phosphate 3-epimerase [Acidobacteriota bacterium]
MKPVVAPSILSADFASLGRDVARAARGGAGLLHVDVMDGSYVPNITIGPPVVAALARTTKLPLDVHLMIVHPERFVGAFRDAGAAMISVHVEAATHLHFTLSAIRAAGAKAGVAINPGTPVGFLPEVADVLDYVLVMSVNPGWGGQKFLPRALEKLREARRLLDRAGRADVLLEVDGGIGPGNVADAVGAGARLLVCGSSVFGEKDPGRAVRDLRRRAEAAMPR